MLATPDPDVAADMYEWLCDELQAAGYLQYEISNWARPGEECLHNLQYWRTEPYLGLGAGAHGHAGGRRYSNVLSIGGYVDRVTTNSVNQPDYPCSSAAAMQHLQTVEDDMGEFMMMGLRLTQEGVSRARFHARFGQELTEIFGQVIAGLIRSGLLEWAELATLDEAGALVQAGSTLRLTGRGRLLGNRVFSEFLGD
jgi:oxygen-independent coproporphyrinogen-3 oxidase